MKAEVPQTVRREAGPPTARLKVREVVRAKAQTAQRAAALGRTVRVEAEMGAIDTSNEDEIVRIRVPMPENWIHTYSLAFACYGPFADNPDPDIHLSASDGPPDAISVEGADSNAADSDRQHKTSSKRSRPLTARIHADKNLSCKDMKKQKAEEAKEARREARKTQVMSLSKNDDEKENRMVHRVGAA